MVLVKAEIVGFVTNATTVCRNDVVSFSCSVLGNPVVRTYLLYANDVMNDYSNGSGVWSRTMTTGGVLDFTCVANNTVGTDRRTVAVTVNGKCKVCIVHIYFSAVVIMKKIMRTLTMMISLEAKRIYMHVTQGYMWKKKLKFEIAHQTLAK